MRGFGMEAPAPNERPDEPGKLKNTPKQTSIVRGGFKAALAGAAGILGLTGDNPPAKAVGNWDTAALGSQAPMSNDQLPPLPTDEWHAAEPAADFDSDYHDKGDFFSAEGYTHQDFPRPEEPRIAARRPDDQEIPKPPEDKDE